MAPGGNVVVLEPEDGDAENRIPSEEEINEYAEFLGIEVEKEPHLMWIAREGVSTPVPQPWKACTENGEDVFYFNFETSESVWDHPCDEKYRTLVEVHRKKFENGESSEDQPSNETSTRSDSSDQDGEEERRQSPSSLGRTSFGRGGHGGLEVTLGAVSEEGESSEEEDDDGDDLKPLAMLQKTSGSPEANTGGSPKKGSAEEATRSPTGLGGERRLGRGLLQAVAEARKAAEDDEGSDGSEGSSPKSSPKGDSRRPEVANDPDRLKLITDELSDEESISEDDVPLPADDGSKSYSPTRLSPAAASKSGGSAAALALEESQNESQSLSDAVKSFSDGGGSPSLGGDRSPSLGRPSLGASPGAASGASPGAGQSPDAKSDGVKSFSDGDRSLSLGRPSLGASPGAASGASPGAGQSPDAKSAESAASPPAKAGVAAGDAAAGDAEGRLSPRRLSPSKAAPSPSSLSAGASPAGRGLAGVGLALLPPLKGLPKIAGDEKEEDELAASGSGRNPSSAMRPEGKLETSLQSGRSAMDSSCASEVSEDFPSEFGASEPGRVSQGGSRAGDTLEFSASAMLIEDVAADAAGSAGDGAAPRAAAAVSGTAQAHETARWERLEAEVSSLSRALEGLRDIREKQQEYIRLLRAGL